MKIDKLINGSKALAGCLLCCLALAGCVREEFNESREGETAETRTYGLGFTLAANALTPSESNFRYGDELENYINSSQLRILFLDKDGNFQFEFSQYNVTEYKDGEIITDPKEKRLKTGLRLEPLRMSTGDAVSQWFVRIPIDDLSDNDLKLITEDGFKIAVMANWPDDTFNGDPEGRSLNTNFLEENSEQNIANRLAHCHYDEIYLRPGRYESYMPFLGKGNDEDERFFSQMSVSMDWVKDWYAPIGNETDQEKYAAAEDDIREKFKGVSTAIDERTSLKGRSGRIYYNMWNIWNFGGEKNKNEFSSVEFKTKDETSKHGYYNGQADYWVKRNKNGWAGRLNNPDELNGIMKTGNYDGVIFAANKNHAYCLVETDYGYGIEMQCLGDNNSVDGNQAIRKKHDDGKKEVFKFLANDPAKGTTTEETDPLYGYFKIPLAADGTLRLKLGAKCGVGGDHRITLGMHFGAQADDDDLNANPPVRTNHDRRAGTYDIIESSEIIESSDAEKLYTVEYDFDVKITERVLDAYLYALCDNPNDRLIIYEIEYFKNVHLADVERDGIAVSKDQPIPMYGIQEFDPIGAYWTPGELFNLSAYTGFHSDKYNYKWISLLRSVAKVELKIAKAPFNGKKPQYVYMRSMNRTARLNPIDVLTPTNQIWYGDAEHNIAGIVQETSNIQSYGPMYEALDEKLPEDTKMHRFRNRLAWFFGIWTHEKVGISASDADAAQKWDWNDEARRDPGKGNDPYYENGEIVYDRSIPSPRVFNPHINRSDYTHFTYEGDDGDYWSYSLYVPEKHMTDCDDPGDLSKTPKCLRIEMRWEGVNDDSNLDDNASYRIYFADPDRGGHLAGIYNRDDYENVENTPDMPYKGAYENDLANLRSFYPIVRNHVYEVTVSGINSGDISYEVRGAAKRDVNIDFD